MLRFFNLLICFILLSATAYSETKREIKEKISELENINVSLKTQIDSLKKESDSLTIRINNLENQIEALLFEVPCLEYSKDLEGEYLAVYTVGSGRTQQTALARASDIAKSELSMRMEHLLAPVLEGEIIRVPRIAKLESVRVCLEFREENDKMVNAYVVYHLPLQVTIDKIIDTMRSYPTEERNYYKNQSYKILGIK